MINWLLGCLNSLILTFKKKIIMNRLVLPFVLIVILFTACNTDKSSQQNEQTFTNPILAGFYPDPSVCKVGENYYLVNSTFAYFPGITIFQSKDMINWKLIGYVLNRPEHTNLDGFGVSRGIFAPSIRFHDGLFYVTCTLVDGGGNFVATAKNPAGFWYGPVWIEAPHIFQKDRFYYLIAAEEGTAEQHSEVVFRSESATGPYIPYENNPILTQRHLDPNRKFPITYTGHADFVQTENGDWWAVFLGCRPFPPVDKNYYNTGRETSLAPVEWIDGWPIINHRFDEVQYFYPLPITPSGEKAPVPQSGNFRYRDNFDADSINLNWLFLRTPHEKWYDLKSRPGFLLMQLQPETCGGKMNPSFLGRRQQHTQDAASVTLNFIAESENEKAGLMIFQNETHYYFLCNSLENQVPVLQLYKSNASQNSANEMELLASQKLTNEQKKQDFFLKIEAHRNVYSFFFLLCSLKTGSC